jgi:voltage-gated potassium channel
MSMLARVPLVSRIAWHARRVARDHHLTPRFFGLLVGTLLFLVAGLALLVHLSEGPTTWRHFEQSLYWTATTVLGQGDPGFVTSRIGYVTANALALVGIGLLSVLTAAIVSFAVDFMVKEGQGMGASQFRGHVVICGWNETARHLATELTCDDYRARIAVLADCERNPAGSDAYFTRGDATDVEDLRRAGVDHAAVVIVCPSDPSIEADMRSVFVVLAVRSLAPSVRIVVEANHERSGEHLRRAGASEILVTSVLASHLAARAALYPGLAALVTDLVSGGTGREVYRVHLPESWGSDTVDSVAERLRVDHGATLLAFARDGHHVSDLDPGATLEPGSAVFVVAESLQSLTPLVADSPVTLTSR